MFGATVLVPILVNQGIAAAGFEGEVLSIAVALVTAGIGTLIYILCTKQNHQYSLEVLLLLSHQ